jgi:hypothetical protein
MITAVLTVLDLLPTKIIFVVFSPTIIIADSTLEL